MKGIKGTSKTYGEKCAMCKEELTEVNAVHRHLPRLGLLSYCRPCLNKREQGRKESHPGEHREASKRNRDRLKAVVLNAYGGRCECCGETTPEFLALDHRNGGGSKHRQMLRSPTELRRLVIKQGFPMEYRLLCHNCNGAIAWFGRCSHQDS